MTSQQPVSAPNPKPDLRLAVSPQLERATALVVKWAQRVGFGHYRMYVAVLPKRERGDCWARVHFDHEEEWFTMEVVPDGTLPEDVLEHTILHEFGHGLIELAELGPGSTELACNRIANLALYSPHPNEHYLMHHPEAQRHWATMPVAKGRLAPILVDALPEKERKVITDTFWYGASRGQLAAELGVSKRTIGRILKKAIDRLDRMYERLESGAA